MTMTISAMADRLGISTDTLRYYERLGLLPTAARTASGYRLYDQALLDRARFIKSAQHIGLRLADIKELLDINDRGACPCGQTTVVVERRLRQVDTELARLRAMRKQLLALRDRNRDCVDPSGEAWCCTNIPAKGGNAR
jgi:MerR family mercuric resistance operon transcriptional regulator